MHPCHLNPQHTGVVYAEHLHIPKGAVEQLSKGEE